MLITHQIIRRSGVITRLLELVVVSEVREYNSSKLIVVSEVREYDSSKLIVDSEVREYDSPKFENPLCSKKF